MSLATTTFALIVSGLLLAGIYVLASLGLSLIFGVLEVVNIAHGGFVMLGGYMSWYAFTEFGVDPVLSILVVIPVMFILGYLMHVLAVEYIIGDDEIYSLLLTFGIALMLEGALLQQFTGITRSIPYLNESVGILTATVGMNRLVAGVLGLVFGVSLLIFLNRSKYGRAIRATAQEPDLAEACGIDTRQIRGITMGIGATLAGIAGVAYLMVYSISPIGAQPILLLLFVIIVLGGMGSLAGTMIASVVVALFEQFTIFYVGAHEMFFVLYLSVAVILLVRPEGLLGEPEARHG
jgi:branched-chain amino acid transport system permease protein